MADQMNGSVGMTMSGDVAYVRNSRSLAVFAEIVTGPIGSMRAVEIAGRGIAAEARCNAACAVDHKHPVDRSVDQSAQEAVAFADWVEDWMAIEDDAVEVWSRRHDQRIDDATFEDALEQIVVRLEAWPANRPQPE